jgi:hypothetical protein
MIEQPAENGEIKITVMVDGEWRDSGLTVQNIIDQFIGIVHQKTQYNGAIFCERVKEKEKHQTYALALMETMEAMKAIRITKVGLKKETIDAGSGQNSEQSG